MAFIEYVPVFNRKYNPEVALDLRSVRNHWKGADLTAETRLNKFKQIALDRLPEYPLDTIDLAAIKASLTYESSIDALCYSFGNADTRKLARGIEQRYDATQDLIKALLNNVGNPLFGKNDHQEAYLDQAQEVAWVISQSYREGEWLGDPKKVGAQTAVHLNIMRLLRAGAPINVSNLL